MNALQLELPGLTARIEDGLLVETSGPDELCGKGLLYARTWELWRLQESSRDLQSDALSDLFYRCQKRE